MTSTISMQEKAPAAWSAGTCCEMSRMRRRNAMHRRRAALTSKLMRSLRSHGAPSAAPRTAHYTVTASCRIPRPPPAPSRDGRPVVIAGVAGLGEQRPPALRIVVELRGEDPALEQRLLL